MEMSERIDQQQVLDEFMEGRPPADQLREWKELLRERLRRLIAERRAADGVPARLDAEILELQRQIQALDREEMITEFVEDSVRATVTLAQVSPEDLEGD
jgi:hypothetical protein